MPGPRALILDYGGVVSRPQRPECVQAMAERLGLMRAPGAGEGSMRGAVPPPGSRASTLRRVAQ